MDESRRLDNQKWNKTESHVPFFSRLKREYGETFKNSKISNICDKTTTETYLKINKQTSPRPRLINDQNWSETNKILRVLMPSDSKPR